MSRENLNPNQFDRKRTRTVLKCIFQGKTWGDGYFDPLIDKDAELMDLLLYGQDEASRERIVDFYLPTLMERLQDSPELESAFGDTLKTKVSWEAIRESLRATFLTYDEDLSRQLIEGRLYFEVIDNGDATYDSKTKKITLNPKAQDKDISFIKTLNGYANEVVKYHRVAKQEKYNLAFPAKKWSLLYTSLAKAESKRTYVPGANRWPTLQLRLV